MILMDKEVGVKVDHKIRRDIAYPTGPMGKVNNE